MGLDNLRRQKNQALIEFEMVKDRFDFDAEQKAWDAAVAEERLAREHMRRDQTDRAAVCYLSRASLLAYCKHFKGAREAVAIAQSLDAGDRVIAEINAFLREKEDAWKRETGDLL